MKKQFLSIFFLLLGIQIISAQQSANKGSDSSYPGGAEFRGAWIATVDNIDWPDRGSYNPEDQRAEYIRLLDMHEKNGLNAVVVQVRPAADAFYPSSYEPWSEWLTGRQGNPP